MLSDSHCFLVGPAIVPSDDIFLFSFYIAVHSCCHGYLLERLFLERGFLFTLLLLVLPAFVLSFVFD